MICEMRRSRSQRSSARDRLVQVAARKADRRVRRGEEGAREDGRGKRWSIVREIRWTLGAASHAPTPDRRSGGSEPGQKGKSSSRRVDSFAIAARYRRTARDKAKAQSITSAAYWAIRSPS